MDKSNVYFMPVDGSDHVEKARQVLDALLEKEKVELAKKLPIKIHTSEPGNISFIRPDELGGVKKLLEEKGIDAFYTETDTAAGIRATDESHREVAKKTWFC